nr:retrovirus-related Pol polyprotein from transposon TNT 1-94 [Tanacetum cinerariifolium]
MSTNTKFPKQSTLGKPPKVGDIHALSKPVSSNSIPTLQESKVMKNDKVIAPEMFMINPFKTSKEEKHVPNNVRASARTKLITISQPPVITKKDVNSNSNGKIIKSSESENQSDCSNGDNACTYNTPEPKIKRFPNSTFLLGRNDHVAAIIGFGDLQWGNILITRVYFVEGLGDHSTNLYTINLYEMASASPIYLMARASSTKSWLWHQRLSHLNFETINDLAKNDLVSEFKNQVLKEYFDSVGISHQVSSVRTPQQNGVVERINQMLVEATRTMLIFPRAALFLWAEAIATACFTQNRSIIHRRFNKTPYELINGKKPDISFLMYSGLCVIPIMIVEILESLVQKKIMETMNVSFDELSTIAFKQHSSKPRLHSMTSRQISSGLDLIYAPSTITTQQPTKGELDLLFEAMYDDYIGGQPSATAKTVTAAQAPQVRQTSTTSTSIADTAPTPTNSSSLATNFPNTSHDVDELNLQQQHAQQQGNQNVKEAMIDPAWIESMQEDLLQFKRLDVWVLVHD